MFPVATRPKLALQCALLDTLVDFGAAVEPFGSGKRRSPLMTALAFGYAAAADALVNRGASIPNLAASAGLGRVSEARQLLEAADADTRHRALAGREAVVRPLVERGARTGIEDRLYHSTPLGWADYGGQTAVAEYLRGYRKLCGFT